MAVDVWQIGCDIIQLLRCDNRKRDDEERCEIAEDVGSKGPSSQMRDINIRIGNSNRLSTEWMHNKTGSVTSPR